MKNLVLLCALLMSAFVVGSYAQAESADDVRATYEKWKAAPKTDGKKQFFVIAHAERLDDVSASLSIGLSTRGQRYSISVKPLKIEREEKFKLIQTTFMEASNLASKPKTPVEDFANPRLTFKVPSEANAVEIRIKFGDSDEPTVLTMKLNGKTRAQLISE